MEDNARLIQHLLTKRQASNVGRPTSAAHLLVTDRQIPHTQLDPPGLRAYEAPSWRL